jgi:branched-chain amino acid transport system permease protein
VVLSAIVVATVVSPSDLFSINRVWGLAIVGLSMVPVVGFAGRLSLCQMTFAGIGAVVVGHLGGGANPLALFAAAGVCAVAGVLVALPTLRLSGIYFALSTAAFATAMDAWVFPLPAFDLFGHQFAPFGAGSLTFAPFRVGGFVASSKELQFVIGSLIFLALVAFVVLLRRSNFGNQLFAFKDSPAASATLGMNTRLLPIAVFAISAAIAGVGGALYGQSLGSVAPDMYQFFTGLSVLLTMVVLGIGSLGAGLGTGAFLGGPTLTNLFPSLLQLQSVLVGAAAVGVGTSPNGLIPSGFRPLWASAFRRRGVSVAIVACLLGLWGLRLGGVIGNWAMVWAMLAVAVAGSVVPYVIDYRRGEAQPAFGLTPGSAHRRLTPESGTPQGPSVPYETAPTAVGSGSRGT